MKRLRFPDLLLIPLVMGLILAGCELNFYEQLALTGTVTIAGPNPPTVGDILSAEYTGGNGTGTASWQWLRGDNVIDGAAGWTYAVTAADVGMTIKARVSYADKRGSVTSTATAAVAAVSFVAVTGITGVPTTGEMGKPLSLSGATVAPTGATNKSITWSIQNAGTTGAVISSGNIFNTTAAGTAVVRAVIANGLTRNTDYTQDFNITITGFVPVTGITGVPTTGVAGTPLTLSGTVAPSNATNKTIVWSVINTATGVSVSISGAVLTPAAGTGAGVARVRATIANGKAEGTAYSQDFNITISAAFVPVTDITIAATTGKPGEQLKLEGTVLPSNATNQTIVWSVRNTATGVFVSINGTNGNTLTPTGTGVVGITATIVNGKAQGTDFTKDFTITIAN